MKLEEAIEHCKSIACETSDCGMEHAQLAEWIIELKELKEHTPTWSEEDEKNFDQINRMKTVLDELVNGEQYEEAAKLKASIARAEEGAMESLRAFKEAFGDDISFEVMKVSEKNPNQ